MNWKDARFVITKTHPKELPERHHCVEIALVGRSNAGKSSFLNAITGHDSLAKTSKTPGKTRHLNLFYVGNHLSIVDLPGYGYAKRSKEEQQEWGAFISSYLHSRVSLKLLILVMDIRRNIEEEEYMLSSCAQSLDIPILLILNKCDKVTQKEMYALEKERLKTLRDPSLSSLMVSCHTGKGIDVARKILEQSLILPSDLEKKI